jgi:hypothetical protein
MSDDSTRSDEACPACGAHEMALVDFPSVSAVGYQVFSETIGMGEVRATTAPAIGCLACGAEWADLASFRAAQAARGADSG